MRYRLWLFGFIVMFYSGCCQLPPPALSEDQRSRIHQLAMDKVTFHQERPAHARKRGYLKSKAQGAKEETLKSPTCLFSQPGDHDVEDNIQ